MWRRSAWMLTAGCLLACAGVGVVGLSLAGCDGPAAPADRDLTGQPLPAKLDKPRLLVEKSACRLTVFDGDRKVKIYRCCTGRGAGDKRQEGDLKTPEGDYRICYKNPDSKFTLSLGLNYPNEKDADRGLHDGQITQNQHDEIVAALRADGIPDWHTPLGGEIMIHGAGADRTGTAGCVGMNDDDIRELYPALAVGTPVTIKE